MCVCVYSFKFVLMKLNNFSVELLAFDNKNQPSKLVKNIVFCVMIRMLTFLSTTVLP